MSGLMLDCDFAVATAGGTTNELIKMQCPAMLVPVADNQMNNIKYLSENGIVAVIGEEKDVSIRSMFSYDKRRGLAEQLSKLHSDSSGKEFIFQLAFHGGK